MKDTKTLLTHYSQTDEIADKLLKDGYDIYCISYGYRNEHDLIIYFDKSVKYYSITRFTKKRIVEKFFTKINDLEYYIRRYCGNVKDYFEIINGKNFTTYSLEVETKNGIDYFALDIVYEVTDEKQ